MPQKKLSSKYWVVADVDVDDERSVNFHVVDVQKEIESLESDEEKQDAMDRARAIISVAPAALELLTIPPTNGTSSFPEFLNKLGNFLHNNGAHQAGASVKQRAREIEELVRYMKA